MHPLHIHILANNNADLSQFEPLFVDGKKLGLMPTEILELLKPSSFLRARENQFHLAGENFEARNQTLKHILALLIEKRLVRKERFELYDVAENFGAEPLALADRALMSPLGFAAYGIHCNAYVAQSAQNIKLWVARRSPTSHVDPNKLDHLVAGGQPHGLSLRDNLAKEAWEEAGIPKELSAQAVSTSLIRYTRVIPHGLRRDTLFVFDLELPPDFTPHSQDGESSDFRLMEVPELRRLLEETDDFKFNVPLVLIDFLIRRGIIGADEPGYTELVCGLRLDPGFRRDEAPPHL